MLLIQFFVPARTRSVGMHLSLEHESKFNLDQTMNSMNNLVEIFPKLMFHEPAL